MIKPADSPVRPDPEPEKHSNSEINHFRKNNITPLIEGIKDHVKSLFNHSKGSHDWDHTLRVYRLCMRIGRKEGADMDVVSIAALLHDIGRVYQDNSKGGVCHALKGSLMALSIIAPLPLTDGQKQNIIHCIRSHRFRGKHPPDTLEAKVLFDADKIDAIGAIGVARAYLFAGEVGARLHNAEMDIEEAEPYSINDTGYREYIVKLSKIKDRILTNEGKKIAVKRHKFMETFFKRFLEEVEGVW